MVSWRGGEQGRGRPGFRLILGNASLCSLELGLYTASGHGDGAAASEDNDGSPQSGGRGKITSAISSNSSRSWLQMEYEDRSLVLLLLHCGQKRAAPRSVCGHEAGRNVKNAGLCNAGLGVARGGGQDNLCWHQLHLITSQRPRSHGPDRIFRLHTGSTAEICSNIDPKMKMYSHKSMKPHAILRIETILIDLTFIKLKTRIIT